MAKRAGVSSNLLIEVWTQNLLNSLLNPTDDDGLKDEIVQAKVGQAVWLDELFLIQNRQMTLIQVVVVLKG